MLGKIPALAFDRLPSHPGGSTVLHAQFFSKSPFGNIHFHVTVLLSQASHLSWYCTQLEVKFDTFICLKHGEKYFILFSCENNMKVCTSKIIKKSVVYTSTRNIQVA